MNKFGFFLTLLVAMSAFVFTGCDKPNALTDASTMIEGTWLTSPITSDKRVRWTFSGGELSVEVEEPIGTKTKIVWSKGGTNSDFLTYKITSDYQSVLEIDKIGWNPTPGFGHLHSVPEKGGQSKFVITELTADILHISSLAESASGTVGGEAQRGFTKE